MSTKQKRRRTATKRHFELEDFDGVVKSDDLPLKRSSRKTPKSRVKKFPKRTPVVEESENEDDDDFMEDFNESIKVRQSYLNLLLL